MKKQQIKIYHMTMSSHIYHRIMGIGISIINLRWSDDYLRFIMRIPIPRTESSLWIEALILSLIPNLVSGWQPTGRGHHWLVWPWMTDRTFIFSGDYYQHISCQGNGNIHIYSCCLLSEDFTTQRVTALYNSYPVSEDWHQVGGDGSDYPVMLSNASYC